MGTVVEWLVKPGDRVQRGDIVAVVETQKGAIEIEIFETGEVEEILAPLNTKVPVGTPLAKIRTEHDASARLPYPAAAEFTLSADHRVSDGYAGALLLTEIGKLLRVTREIRKVVQDELSNIVPEIDFVKVGNNEISAKRSTSIPWTS